MHKGRLEAFSDGVIAIIITIMVLEIKAPHGSQISDLVELWPKFLSYIISFIYVAIYWNNHHHLLQATKHVNGKILWANMGLLFSLSLFPFAAAWMGENHFDALPVAGFGLILLLSAFAFNFLQHYLSLAHGSESIVSKAKNNTKNYISIFFYLACIGSAFIQPALGFCCACIPALMWLIPDQKIEAAIDRS